MTNLNAQLLTDTSKPATGFRLSTITFKSRMTKDGTKSKLKAPNLFIAVPIGTYDWLPAGYQRSIYQTAVETYQDEIISEQVNAQLDSGIAPTNVVIDDSQLTEPSIHAWLTDISRAGGKRLTKELVIDFFNESVKSHIQLRIAKENNFNVNALTKDEQELLDAAADKWLDQFTKFAGPSYAPSDVLAKRLAGQWSSIDAVSKTEAVWMSIDKKLTAALNPAAGLDALI